MSLHDVILSLLREPMSGTEMVELFKGSIGHFWNADLSQIYRALDSLERAGCVRSKTVPSSRGPARRVYRLTARGRRRLTEWIRRPPKIPRGKFEYLAQLFSVTDEPQPASRARELLIALRDESRSSLANLRAIDAYMREIPGYPDEMPGEFFYPWLTLRHGLLRLEALVGWSEECLTRLDRRPEDTDDTISPEVLSLLSEMLEATGKQVELQAQDSDGRKKNDD